MNNMMFRVWCKNKKEWEKDQCYMNQLGEVVFLTRNGLRYYNPLTHIVSYGTGRTDKNDKNIYEGDYVLIGHPEIPEYGNTSIFRIDRVKDLWGYRFQWQWTRGYHCTTHILEDDYSNCEVIGNIYENPELLEVEE